jgi:hypothetical protein
VCNSIDGIRTVHGLAQRRFRVIELMETAAPMVTARIVPTTRDALVPIE